MRTTLVLVTTVFLAVALLLKLSGSSAGTAEGQLRCEGGGAVVVKIGGRDYAANAMASRRYPPIQQIWNDQTYPSTSIDRIIVRGLTLCDW